MSGIVGLVNWDGTPIERDELERMTAFLAFRGPDDLDTWTAGSVGLGHTLLRTTFKSQHEQQPISFDDRVWIVADARIDGREELIAKLTRHRRWATQTKPAVELILHSYHAWGEKCVEPLI